MNRHKSFGTYRKVNIKQLLTSFCMFLLTMSMLIGCSRSEEKDNAIFEKEQLEKDLLTSSLKKYVFYNWLINSILYLCVT